MKENLGNLSQTSKEDESEIETKDREKYFRGLGRKCQTGNLRQTGSHASGKRFLALTGSTK